MKRFLSFLLAAMLLAIPAFADNTACEHDFLTMRNLTSHYEECQKCFEIRNAGNHTFASGTCTVCGYEDTEVRGEGEHDHKLMNGADDDYHFQECQVCFERFNVKDHTFQDGKCTFCGHAELVNPFTDVSENAWFYNDVLRAYGDGLINGKTKTTFAPDMNITYVEAIKLAACMYQKYTEGEVTLAVGNPWYQPYLDYCIENGILREEHGYDLNAPATRQGYMRIFAYSLPPEALEEINYVAEDAIPDVKKDPAIYKLYRAGIVGGVDAARNCNPNANIKRSEVAAVLTRMMNKAARIEFTLGEKPAETEPLRFTGATSYSQDGNYVFSATFAGGKAPYTFTWYWSDGEKGTVLKSDKFVTFESKSNEALASFVFSAENPYLGKELKLAITDADGEKIDTGYTDIPAYFAIQGPAEEQEETYDKLTVTKQPEYIASAEDGMLMHYTVEVQGGKAPYTYEWRYYTGYKNQSAAIVNGEYAHADGNVLKLGFYMDNPYLTKQIYCKITDANGESVTTNWVRMPEAPFTMELEDMIKNSLGTILVGRVKTGKLVPGEYLVFTFDDKYTYGNGKVEAIEMFNKQLDEATAGDRVGLLFKEIGTFNTRAAVLKCDKQGLIGDTKNIAIKESLRVGVSYTPRGNIGDWTKMTVYGVGGMEPYTYEWQALKDGKTAYNLTSIAKADEWANGFNEATLNIKLTEQQFAFGMSFRCMVTDAAGNIAYSDAYIPTVHELVIANHPESVYANYGDAVQFTVKAMGEDGSALTYKWRYIYDGAKTFKDILPTDTWASGYDTDTLTIQVEKAELTNHVYYHCVVTDAEGNEKITAAATVFPDKPFISKQPGVVAAKPDTYIEFGIKADGRYKPLTYKWYYWVDGMEFFYPVSKDHEWAEGETTDTLTVGVDRKYFDGSFKCYCLVTDAKGNEVKSLEGSVTLSDDASVNLETGHAPKDEVLVLLW